MVHRLLTLSVISVFFLVCLPAAFAAGPEESDLSFLDGLSLVVLDTEDIPSLHLARRMIYAYGGTVAIMSPPSVLIGWVPIESRDALVGKAGIREIYYSEVRPGEVRTHDPQSSAMVEFFNAAVRGDIAAEYSEFMQTAPPAGSSTPREPDVFVPEAMDEEAYMENLRSAGLDMEALADQGLLLDPSSPAPEGNSDYMTGTVAVTLFFIESDGTGSDPDLYTWTPESMQRYLSGVSTALLWWASRAAGHGDCWVTFLINYYSGFDPRCQQWTEPILHDTSYEQIWVTEIMTNFGYTSGSRLDRVRAFNTWQRSYYQTNRSYSAFIPYNPVPASTSFPGGATAYAYWYGPYTVLLYRVQGWTTAQVFAHETGHIFGACDEYSGGCGSYSCTSICTNGALNANCEDCNENSRDCMMKANSYSLCQYTVTHVGWEVTNPCAPDEPPLLPSPTLASVDPPYGRHGLAATLTVTGTDFYPGVRLDFGSDVFVHTMTIEGGTTITAQVSVLASAPPGLRDLRVINRDGQYATLPGAFEIRSTTRHYYSPSGGDHPPYVVPLDAATSLENAIEAAFDGDTVFVASTTFDDFSIIVQKGVLLYGGWNTSFTQRNLETGKTVLNLDGNATFIGVAEGAGGLDGFLLQNGTGAYDVVPFAAYFGGAVRFVGGTAVVANCEIRSNGAGSPEGYGVGGAIFANGCAVDIRDNYIHNNSATQGGAVYLRQCTGSLANNTISDNTLTGTEQPRIGGGIALLNSSNIALTGNTVTGNGQARDGGGLYIEDCIGVTVASGTVNGNTASLFGGGAAVEHSTALVDGVDFLGNSSAVIGGGLSVMDTSLVVVSGSSFVSNTGMMGGGVYAGGSQFSVRHSLFAENNATSSGGALAVGNLPSGEIIGNTLDGNTSAGVAGISIGTSGIVVFNNIVSNSTGMGVSCTGSPVPALSYNLAWNNTGGDYSGCTPGIGSLSANPLFVDPSGGDYHLGLHSPAIDAGRPGTAYGDPDGSRGDMGIYGSHAFTMDQPSYPKNLGASSSGGQVLLSWSRNPEGDVASYAVYGDEAQDFIPSLTNFVTLVAGTDSSVALALPPDSLYYRISAVDADGYAGGYSAPAFFSPVTGIGDRPAGYAFALHQNVPNPFNPATRIAYELPERMAVSLRVYDVDGRLVRSLVEKVEGPGLFSVAWEGRNDAGEPVASGVYFYRLVAGPRAETKKMVFLK